MYTSSNRKKYSSNLNKNNFTTKTTVNPGSGSEQLSILENSNTYGGNGNETEKEINELVQKITSHLDRFNRFENTDIDDNFINKNTTLTIGNNSIKRECFLHYISGNVNFLNTFGVDCSKVIFEHSDTKKNTLNLEALLKLSADSNFETDSNFYKNLYGFNISIADFISNGSDFKNTDDDTKKTILNNYQKFIVQSIICLEKYMNRYDVIDDKLINSSYNLLYLHNALTYKHMNVGTNISELTTIHDKLINTIKDNISLYNKTYKAQFNTPDKTRTEASISTLIGRSNELIEQQEKLKEQLNKLSSDSNELNDRVAAKVKSIGDNLKPLRSK